MIERQLRACVRPAKPIPFVDNSAVPPWRSVRTSLHPELIVRHSDTAAATQLCTADYLKYSYTDERDGYASVAVFFCFVTEVSQKLMVTFQ